MSDEPTMAEEFCSRCFAGVESSEHHENCVVTGHAADGVQMTTKPAMTDVIAKVIEENLLDDSPDYWPSFKAWAQEAADELVKAGYGDVAAAKAGVIHRVRDACERVLLPHQETGEQTGIDFKPAVDQILYALDGADQ